MRRRKEKRFLFRSAGFTIIELLIVIAILGILSAYVLSSMNDARSSAYLARAETELENFHDGLQLYRGDHGSYPPDGGEGFRQGWKIT